jgi:ribosomal protein L37AE/L43A
MQCEGCKKQTIDRNETEFWGSPCVEQVAGCSKLHDPNVDTCPFREQVEEPNDRTE